MRGMEGTRLLLPFTAWAAMSACSTPLMVEAPTVGASDDQQATCKVAKDPLNPLIIEWPGTSKIDLDVRSQRGLVAVSYSGCTLKVLPSCDIGGGYKLTRVTPARERMEISTATELYARLPLGAASLKGELATGSTLDLEYVAVGQRVAEAPPGPGSGECGGATHYVRTITVGAYGLDARANAGAGVGVDVAGLAGAQAGRQEAVRRVRGSGEVEVCSSKPDDPACAAVIQLGLASLSVATTGPSRNPSEAAGIPVPAQPAMIPATPGVMQRIPGGTVTLCRTFGDTAHPPGECYRPESEQ